MGFFLVVVLILIGVWWLVLEVGSGFGLMVPIFQVILLEKFLGSKVSMGHLTNQLIRLVNPKSHQNGKRVKRGLLSHIGVHW